MMEYIFKLYRTIGDKDYLLQVVRIMASSANEAQSKFNEMSCLPNYSFYTKAF